MASARLKVPDCGPLLVFLTIANQIWIKFETLIVTAKKYSVNEYFQNDPEDPRRILHRPPVVRGPQFGNRCSNLSALIQITKRGKWPPGFGTYFTKFTYQLSF